MFYTSLKSIFKTKCHEVQGTVPEREGEGAKQTKTVRSTRQEGKRLQPDITLSALVYMRRLHKLLDADRPSVKPGLPLGRVFHYGEPRGVLEPVKHYSSRSSAFCDWNPSPSNQRDGALPTPSFGVINIFHSPRFMTS